MPTTFTTVTLGTTPDVPPTRSAGIDGAAVRQIWLTFPDTGKKTLRAALGSLVGSRFTFELGVDRPNRKIARVEWPRSSAAACTRPGAVLSVSRRRCTLSLDDRQRRREPGASRRRARRRGWARARDRS